jgi:phosphoglycerate dehydrogenase-like enzyme
MAGDKIKVGVTADAIREDTRQTFFDSAALSILDRAPELAWEYIPERVKTLTADQFATYDVICVVAAGVDRAAVARKDLRTRLVAGFGAGYDTRDVAALTERGVLLTNNPDAVRRPMATTELTFILALAHQLMQKDRITRAGQWAEQRRYTGMGLTGRTLGSIGVGNIGKELFRIAKPLEMRYLAHDPFVRPEELAPLGVQLVDFDRVFRESDFVCVNVPLSAKTRKLIDARAFALMKPTAYFISTARGPIVDEAALYAALKERRIAGAGMDVFEVEPTPADNPILKLDNVVVSPHALCHTDECNRLLAEGSFKAACAFARREMPHRLVNPEALEHPRLRQWYGKG